jgi:outer membrane protein
MRVLAIASILILPALAVPALRADDLSLEQALALAQSHNPTLTQDQATLDQARERKLAALAAFLPKLNLGAGQSQSGLYLPNSGSFISGTAGTSLGLSASLNLFHGLADKAALDQADAALSSAEQDLRVAVAGVAYAVKSAWAQLLYAQEQVALSDQIADRGHQNSAMVQLSFNVGTENKGSLLETQAQAIQADAGTRSSRRALAAAQRNLARVLGQDNADLKAVGDFPTMDPPPPGDDAKLAETLPTIIKARLAVAQARAALHVSDGAYLPSLDAQAGLNRDGNAWLPQNGSWSMGLSLSWNLFNGFSDSAARSSAEAALLGQEASLEDAIRQGVDALADARDALANTLDLLTVQKASLDANETRAEIARAQYVQGLITFTDWDLIESSLISAQQSSLSGRLNVALSIFAWQEALSKGWEP